MKQAEHNVAMQRSLGLNVDILDPDEMTDVVPILDTKGMQVIGATFCPTDGHADPFETTFAYAAAARDLGAQLHTHVGVTGIKTHNKAVVSVQTNTGVIKTDTVVNAAGVWSKQIASMVGVKLPNMPFRKEALATERFKSMFQSMVISFRDGIYFSQQPEGYIIGGIPVPEERSGYRTMPTFSFLQHMSRTLTRYAPVLKYVNVVRQWTSFYDVTPDARPILGEVKGLKGFIQCNGFSGHGFMLSPMVTKLLTEYIVHGKTSDILDRLRLHRFKRKKIEREMSVVG
jgi:sarcosine oxidase subunit beta